MKSNITIKLDIISNFGKIIMKIESKFVSRNARK